MTNKDNCLSRLTGRLLHFSSFMTLMAAAIIMAGCAAPFAAKKEPDISHLKLEDFSELKTPGTGCSALFIVGCYDVGIEKFAIVRIAVDQMQSVLPQDDRNLLIKQDGIYAAMTRVREQEVLTSLLNESKAKLTKKTSLLFYDDKPEDFWLTRSGTRGTVKYKETGGVEHLLNMNEGYLGISFGILFERRLLGIPFTVSPQFQRKDALPEEYLKRIGDYSKNGRMTLTDLSFTASMNIGDYLVICPDIMPLDEGTFSNYAFMGEKESTFRIYCIYCKSITGI